MARVKQGQLQYTARKVCVGLSDVVQSKQVRPLHVQCLLIVVSCHVSYLPWQSDQHMRHGSASQ
jgi:hypothetical protein